MKRFLLAFVDKEIIEDVLGLCHISEYLALICHLCGNISDYSSTA